MTRIIDVRLMADRKRWRKLPADQLENLILTIRRRAVFEHVSQVVWHEVELMRRRLARLGATQ
jgi:hypothetical protein